MLCIKNGNLVLPDRIEKSAPLFVEAGKIIGVGGKIRFSSGLKVIDARGLYVSPGFIDIHVHGIFAGGPDDLREEDILRMCRRMAASGVTGFLATTVSVPSKTLLHAAKTVKSFLDGRRDTNLLGLHLEGPYLSPFFCGAQNPRYLRAFKPEELKKVLAAGKGIIKAMTFAPEIKNGMSLLKFLTRHSVVPSIGHSAATYKEARAACENGARHVTHLFNAMPAFHHRDPGLVGAALTIKDLTVDIIADGIHLDRVAVKLAVEEKGADKVILISDRLAFGRQITLGGLKVRVGNGPARLENGRLAGSIIGLNQAVKNIIKFTGADLPAAVGMATLNPARLLGIQHRKGTLEAGKDADIVIFDKELKIRATIIKGKMWN